MKALLKWTGIILGGLIALGLVLDAGKTPEEKAAEQAARDQAKAAELAAAAEQERKAMESLPAVTPRQMAEAYEANTVAADQQYKGKRFKVSGAVQDINTDFTGNPYITMKNPSNQFSSPQFGFDESAAPALAKLRPGDKVTLICTGRGDIAKTPIAGDCILM